MIPVYPFQLPTQEEPIITAGGGSAQVFYNWMRVVYLRTGGPAGLDSSMGAALTADGSVLSDDYNEVLSGSGGAVMLANLQPGQEMRVFNGTGGGITVRPFTGGQIDGASSYSLPNNKTQRFTCTALLVNGSPFYRSQQLG